MKFYDFPAAPSPRKVGLFVAEKGLQVPTVTVDLRARAQLQPQFLTKNPAGTVPVLELDDGTCLTESLAICHYLEQLHPEPNLLGADAKEQALVLMWNDIQTLEGYTAIQDVLRNTHAVFKDRAVPGPTPYEQIAALADRGRQQAEAFFDRLETRLGHSRFIASERFTYADIVGFVYFGFAIRTLASDPSAARPNLKRWSEGIAARPAIKGAG